ncbi:outer membrane beta-barrel protein [Dyadobacter pollutisoli]|uniref:Outer membrane beta-barrel protein n=1 Tax=Dyadobacter pollutisoli TaxID=2910158 RepID=A0A9E8N8X0_9BACT|nr:outer membrane beta-barrel protein [Dyadobacter pollutisoli]WAC11498.1 outer membrane beta-barrel protein [Dyadobacter pollutisoli]
MDLAEVRGSIDGHKLIYKGDPYPEPSPTALDVGLNVGIAFMTSPGGTIPKPQGLNRFQKAAPSNLYASTNPALINGLSPAEKPYSFMDHVAFEGVLQFIKKRTKDGGAKVNLDYLEVPVQALYYHELQSKGSIVAGLGPYLAFGTGGKIKNSFSNDKVSTFDKDNGFKRFDGGVIFSAGYKMYDSFSFRLAYEMGLVNIIRENSGAKVKNRTISLNVGYPIHKLIKIR